MVTYVLIIALTAVVGALLTSALLERHLAVQVHEMAAVQQDPATFTAHLLKTVNQSLLWAGLVAAAAALLLSVAAARRIAIPIRRMVGVTEAIARGEYDRRVAVRSPDEVAQLADSINQMAARLAEIEGLRRQLVANIAHELRTPLTSIDGYMDALLDGVFPADPKTFHLVKGEAKRLIRLVEDLQELSRLEFDEAVTLHSMDLPPVIEGAVEMLRPRFVEKGVALTTHIQPGLPPVWGDPERLRQVLVNLLDNAWRFTDTGGQVTVMAISEGDVLRVTVADTGSGIPPEDLPYIFERFYRGEQARVRGGGGAGIGLAIVKSIVARHGGSVAVASRPGNGSRFEFTVPKYKGPTAGHT
jgi:signal transduction histidine kinase